MLDREFTYFRAHQQELVEQYPNKFLVIKGDEIIGVYNSEIEAYQESQKTNALGTFLIQQSKAGKEAYTQTFHSRAIFA